MGIFLKLEGIESDATEKKHHGWIACDSFKSGTQRNMDMSTGQGKNRPSDPAELDEIHLDMMMHKASPKVFLMSVLGETRKATIHVTRAGDLSGSDNYLEIELHDAHVTEYSVTVAGEDSGLPWESICLNFTKIHQTYKPNKADGKPGAPVRVSYNLATGEK
jgi:type VI secretion system Hcp family effector